jgi:hypothetical protein
LPQKKFPGQVFAKYIILNVKNRPFRFLTDDYPHINNMTLDEVQLPLNASTGQCLEKIEMYNIDLETTGLNVNYTFETEIRKSFDIFHEACKETEVKYMYQPAYVEIHSPILMNNSEYLGN